MKFNKLIIAAALALSPFTANALDVGVGVKGGTTGVGFDLSVAVTDTLNLRFSSSSYDFGESDSEEIDINSDDGTNIASITAETNVDFGATGLLLDWYVFDGTFHLTAGMLKNDTKLSLDGVLNGTDVTFDGTTYNIEDDFTSNKMGGSLAFGDSYEPYIGIGWGRKAAKESGFSISAEIGVMILSPSVNLTAPTHVDSSIQSDLDADVNAAEDEAKDELSDFELYPVLTVGINYAF